MRNICRFVVVACVMAPSIAAAQAVARYPAPEGVDVGVRVTDVSGDAARFQRFRDVGDGAFLERFRFDEARNGWRFQLSADHVGRQDQRYRAEYRDGGKIALSFQWDQVPLFISQDTQTLYTRESSGVLRIADSIQQGIQAGTLQLSNVTSQASLFDIQSRRDVAMFSLVYRASRDVDAKFSLKSTKRGGSMPFGATFGFSNLVEVAAPIDTRTTDARAAVEWVRPRRSFRVFYDGSWFENHIDTLIWDNPWRLSDATTAGSQGRMALWPDSTMHSIGTAASLKLPAETHASANITVGSWRQNEKLLPLTINTTITGLELARETADAEARTLAMNYTVTSRPVPKLWLNARFRYHDFDNRTPPFHMTEYVRYDSARATLPSGETEALSATRHNFDVEASYTPLPFTALRAGYSRDWTDRTHRIFARTSEDVVRASVDTTGFGWLTLRAIVERATREGSGFDEETLEQIGEQPELRHFDVANRNRNRVTALVQITPVPLVGVSASVANGRDDYADSGFGLRDNENRIYSLSLDLVPAEQLAAGLSFSRETYSALQRSRTASPGVQFTDPTRDWFIDSSDRVHTVEANFDVLKALPRTDLRLAYGWTRSKAAYVHGVPAGSTIPAPVTLPSVLNETEAATVDVRYYLTDRVAVGAVFWYDRYDVQDFSLGPDTISRLDLPGSLFLGYVFRPYIARSAWLRLTYLW